MEVIVISTVFENLKNNLKNNPKIWLVTGRAGFIGSNLLEALLKLDQKVIGLDNFSTGYQHNLDEVKSLVTPDQWSRFTFIEGDIRKRLVFMYRASRSAKPACRRQSARHHL